MKNNIKKIFYLFIVIGISFIFNISYTKAACSVSVSTSKSAVVGSTFKVTATVSSDVGSWYYILGYDASKVRLVSGDTKVVGVKGDARSVSYTFKSLASGTATFRATNVSLASNATNSECSAYAGSASISMKTQAEIEASYSKNNNLSSLAVEGAELSPAFNKDTLEYSATLPVDTTKAIIKASPADGTASIEGAGEKDVVDGMNKLQIVVTAQHGEKKTYTINLTVQELDPIKVKVDNKNYTVVRKSGQIKDIPTGFVEEKIKIDSQDITAYKSSIAKLTLVGLKDEKGNISLFIYDKKNNKYSKFQEVKGSSTNILILSNDKKAPSGFKKSSIKIDKVSIDGYKLKDIDTDRYYLVYGQNIETGSKGFYLYNSNDKTFQLYFSKLIDSMNEDIKIREYIILGLGAFFILWLLTKFFGLFKSRESRIRKYRKKLDKLTHKNMDDDSYELPDVEEKEPSIRKIEDDEYTIPRKSKKQKLEEIKEAKERLERSKPSYRRVSLEDDDE